jgi:AcrR family transcriptional regulator
MVNRRFIDESMLDGFEAPGMRPAQQMRSRKLIVDLFNEALLLLREVDFEGLSIDTLCERASATVGSFYSRFENKDAFVNALQRMLIVATRRTIETDYASSTAPVGNLDHLINWIAKGVIAWYQRNEGVIRASLRRANVEAGTWTPMQELGGVQIEQAVPRILALLPKDVVADGAEDRARFAFQILFGTLNNLVLIDPGPFGLNDRETSQMLASSMVQLIWTAPSLDDRGSKKALNKQKLYAEEN